MRCWERHIRIEWGVNDVSDEAVAQSGNEDGVAVFSDTMEFYYPAGKNRHIEFRATAEAETSATKGECKVYNLSDATLEKYYRALKSSGFDSESEECDAGFIPWMNIYAGYGDWCPLIFTGKIAGLPKSEYTGADVVTTFSVVDDQKNVTPRLRCNETFPPGTMHSDIVRVLVMDLGMPLGADIALGFDYAAKDGVTFSPNQTIRDALAHEAEITGSVCWFNNDHVYFQPAAYGQSSGITLSVKTGLLFSTTPVHKPQWGGNEDIAFTHLMNAMLKPKVVVAIDSIDFKGSVNLVSVEYAIGRSEFYCICKATLEEGDKEQEREDALLAQMATMMKQAPVHRNGWAILAGPEPTPPEPEPAPTTPEAEPQDEAPPEPEPTKTGLEVVTGG